MPSILFEAYKDISSGWGDQYNEIPGNLSSGLKNDQRLKMTIKIILATSFVLAIFYIFSHKNGLSIAKNMAQITGLKFSIVPQGADKREVVARQ